MTITQASPIGTPLVSVIIPTYRRPGLLRLAVDSVLAQTYPNLEVIVVHDGPDPETAEAMRGIDPRVRYHELAVNSGPGAARNAGIDLARGEWIGFLDDDDRWLPHKLQTQIAALVPGERNIILASRCIYEHGDRRDIWPARPIGENEDLADYLLCRNGIFERPGVLPIHSLLVPRHLLTEVPLVTAADHEDWSWMLHVWHRAGARFRFIWEPLVTYTVAVDSISRSRRMNWLDSIAWANLNRAWIGNAAYASFLATKVALKAKRKRDWRGLLHITRLVWATDPSLLNLTFLAGMFLLPSSLLNAAWRKSLKSKDQVGTSRVQPQ